MKQTRMNGNSLIINLNPTKFQVNDGVSTNLAREDWINLGIHLEVCLTHPESCGAAGGAISLWFRLNGYSIAGAIVTTTYNTSAGYHIVCDYRGIP